MAANEEAQAVPVLPVSRHPCFVREYVVEMCDCDDRTSAESMPTDLAMSEAARGGGARPRCFVTGCERLCDLSSWVNIGFLRQAYLTIGFKMESLKSLEAERANRRAGARGRASGRSGRCASSSSWATKFFFPSEQHGWSMASRRRLTVVEEPPMAAAEDGGAGTAAAGPFAAARESPLLVLLLVIFVCNCFLAGAFPSAPAHGAGRGAGAQVQASVSAAAAPAAAATASAARASSPLSPTTPRACCPRRRYPGCSTDSPI